MRRTKSWLRKAGYENEKSTIYHIGLCKSMSYFINLHEECFELYHRAKTIIECHSYKEDGILARWPTKQEDSTIRNNSICLKCDHDGEFRTFYFNFNKLMWISKDVYVPLKITCETDKIAGQIAHMQLLPLKQHFHLCDDVCNLIVSFLKNRKIK